MCVPGPAGRSKSVGPGQARRRPEPPSIPTTTTAAHTGRLPAYLAEGEGREAEHDEELHPHEAAHGSWWLVVFLWGWEGGRHSRTWVWV